MLGDALIEFVDWFGLSLRVVLALLMKVAAPVTAKHDCPVKDRVRDRRGSVPGAGMTRSTAAPVSSPNFEMSRSRDLTRPRVVVGLRSSTQRIHRKWNT